MVKILSEYDHTYWQNKKESWIDHEDEDDEVDAIEAEKRRTDFIKFCRDQGHDLQARNQLYTLTLAQGSTVILPGGWIHCVFTPEGKETNLHNYKCEKPFLDSVVFGGLCLHSFSTKIQTKILNIEKDTKEEEYHSDFIKLHWYAAQSLRKELKTANRNKKQNFSKAKLDALIHIYGFLMDKLKRAKKKNFHEEIPQSIEPEEQLDLIQKEITTSKRFGFSMLLYNIICINSLGFVAPIGK